MIRWTDAVGYMFSGFAFTYGLSKHNIALAACGIVLLAALVIRYGRVRP